MLVGPFVVVRVYSYRREKVCENRAEKAQAKEDSERDENRMSSKLELGKNEEKRRRRGDDKKDEEEGIAPPSSEE